MATKLKNLKIKKVDFVDEGANPDAYVRLTKNKGSGDEQPTGEGIEKGTGVLHRLFSFIGKAAGVSQDEIDSALEDIQKNDSASFNEKYREAKNRKISDEIWDMCYALQSSLCSILNDEELDSAGALAAMQKSLEEFHAVALECIAQWSDGKEANIAKKEGKITAADIALMKSAVARLTEEIEKAAVPGKEGPKAENVKGEEKDMKIDKSKLTEAERAFFDSIVKKYGVEETGATAVETAPEEDDPAPVVAKSTAPAIPAEAQTTETQDDIYKGLHPVVRAELESLKKFREEAETRELYDVAKKYELIGKKPDELAPVLKSLKAAGGTAYDDMIAVLDQTLETVEKSGVFSEIGKSGHDGDNSAESKVDGIAKNYMEKDPALSYNQAVAKAWEDHPELIAEYDEQAGF